MTLVLGIDPGAKGAFAVYDTVTRSVVGDIVDTPYWYQTVGKKRRPRVDALEIADMFDMFGMMGVQLIVIEAVGGRTGQSASAGFQFGYSVGITYMAALFSGIAIETVPPQTWKQQLNVPGKSKADDTAIMARADELFPHDRQKFRGIKGGKKLDRAEAAMIAKFGGDFILNTLAPEPDVERRLANAHADTGA